MSLYGHMKSILNNVIGRRNYWSLRSIKTLLTDTKQQAEQELGNQNLEIENRQTTQLTKDKGQKHKQRSTKN